MCPLLALCCMEQGLIRLFSPNSSLQRLDLFPLEDPWGVHGELPVADKTAALIGGGVSDLTSQSLCHSFHCFFQCNSPTLDRKLTTRDALLQHQVFLCGWRTEVVLIFSFEFFSFDFFFLDFDFDFKCCCVVVMNCVRWSGATHSNQTTSKPSSSRNKTTDL